MRTLEEASLEASTCTKCALAQGRTQVVYGAGDPRARLMFIGEAPGFHEDRQGVPFVGAAGGLLTGLLQGIGLSREDVYIANVLKCLRYNARVQLADGSWERIGKLVRNRYDGKVMSAGPDGSLVARSVNGWYESPLGNRRVFRLTYKSAKNAGANQVAIHLTGDHEVLTEEGFVAVENLPTGARIATGQGLSELARDVVCGTLLGDGSLNAKSSHLSVAHSATQGEYALFKAELLAELEPRVSALEVAAVGGGAQTYGVVQVRTLAHRALAVMRRDFYSPTKRVPAWVVDTLNNRMLAFWFMDGGYTQHRPTRQPRSEIATNGFDSADLELLVEALGRLGLDAKPMRGRLFFDVVNSRELSKRIAPFVPPVMRYKLVPDIAQLVPFDPERFHPGRTLVMFDEAIVQDITDWKRTDSTFFCIDVDETHNFVTAGGVVHNCRPPGNRDPQPEEIEACSPWLEEQIDLIDPAVICTLGNFSTRLLLGKPAGISRVRGQRFKFRGRVLIPTFHPAAILHGGRTSNAMAQMEDDFRLLAKTLDEIAAQPEPRSDPQADAEQLGLF